MKNIVDNLAGTRKRKTSNPDEADLWQYAKLFFCASGTLFCYLWFGIIQESVTKGKYGSDGAKRFTYTQALVFVQCALNSVFAYILRGKAQDNVPIRLYAFMAMSYMVAMIASNHALQFLPYPTQVLGKSCKPVPILVFGILFAGKKYNWRKCLFVLMIVVGVALFLYKDKSDSVHSKPFKFGFGEVLLLLSLTMDGTTGAIQDYTRHNYVANGHSMMYVMNLLSSIVLMVGLLITGELFAFVTFIYLYPKVIVELLALAAANALGQFFVFKTVTEFGPLTCSVITTTRKLFTMLGSVILFGNALSERQYVATLIVFTGLLLDAAESRKSHSSKKSQVDEGSLDKKLS